MSFRRLTFDVPLILFFLSTLWGVGIAYDQPSAWLKLSFICGGLTLYGFLKFLPLHSQQLNRALHTLWGALPTLIAVYFLLTNDWNHPDAKLPMLDPLRAWFAQRQLNLPLPRWHPYTAGGLIAMLLPLQIVAFFAPPHGQATIQPTLDRTHVGLGGLCITIALLGLLMSVKRGAWVMLAAASGLWAVWQLCRLLGTQRRLSQLRTPQLLATIWSAGLLAALMLWLVSFWLAPRLGIEFSGYTIWRYSFALANDYVFTGLGLGDLTLAFSSYAFLINVPFFNHAHHLFLNIWLAHGMLGLMAFGWWLYRAFTRSEVPAEQLHWQIAAKVSLCYVLLHGLIEDVFYGYGGMGLVWLFVPLAVIERSSRHTGLAVKDKLTELPAMQPHSAVPRWHEQRALLALCVGALLVIGISWHPVTRALYHANLGALTQTRIELPEFTPEKWGLQDAPRRRAPEALAPARADYAEALWLDPDNPVANRRLGQIELSLGAYEEARQHLERAYAMAPQSDATRQLLGEAYAVSGAVGSAAELWRTVRQSENQLYIRLAWYKDFLGDQQRAQWVTEAIALAQKK